ncbi:MAG: recombinase [Clostridium sp. 29_15]|nr:MAG: recombinase [Clostridium sp. 29_15]
MCSQRNISKGVKGCRNKHVYDMTLVSAFVDIFNNMIENKDYFIKKWNEVSNNGNELQKYKAKQFIGILDKAIQIEEFNESLFFIFIEKMTVFEGENIIVTLLDGTEFEVEI